jgi:hypothetical protein
MLRLKRSGSNGPVGSNPTPTFGLFRHGVMDALENLDLSVLDHDQMPEKWARVR